MADTEKFYDDLIIINLYHMRSAKAHDDLALFFKRKNIYISCSVENWKVGSNFFKIQFEEVFC